jgi:hypothetical protein
MAQIMKYWVYPAQGMGSFTYADSIQYGYNENIGTLSANFGTATYQWSEMPQQLGGDNTAVATLMYECGVAVGMNYGANGSYAYFASPAHPNALHAFTSYFASLVSG